jgi:predicted HicB family RNase H-like nuclease
MSAQKRTKPAPWKTLDGTPISEADAARLAAEFESDDSALDHAEVVVHRTAGRPSLTGRKGSSPQVTFRVSPTVRERAEQLAVDRGTTVSALAREALEQLIKKVG